MIALGTVRSKCKRDRETSMCAAVNLDKNGKEEKWNQIDMKISKSEKDVQITANKCFNIRSKTHKWISIRKECDQMQLSETSEKKKATNGATER